MSVNARRILNAIRDADHVLNDPGAGGLIDPFGDLQICELTTSAAESRTLANPTKAGIRLTLRMKTDGGDCTITVGNGVNVDGDTQAVFANVGDQLELISVSTETGFRWEVLVNTGPAALSGAEAVVITVAGGTQSSDGSYNYHTFNSSGDLVISGGSLSVEYCVVGGGGGGAASNAGCGGGGGGGQVQTISTELASGTYAAVIGAGGAAGTSGSRNGVNGGTSSFNGTSSIGGGGGGGLSSTAPSGASGGGAIYGQSGGTGTAGNNGAGGATGGTTRYAAGGGGGAGSAGSAGNIAVSGGNGGNGVTFGPLSYGGGGGGGAGYEGSETIFPGGTGNGGGGDGGTGLANGVAGVRGGGGGGGGFRPATPVAAGAGGSGVVVVRYLSSLANFGVGVMAVGTTFIVG